MQKQSLLYEGKAKKIYQTDDKQVYWVEYLDQATALNGLKKDSITGKGTLNNQITSAIFQELRKNKIESHFVEMISKTEQLIEAVTMFPLEVVVRNITAGSFAKRFGKEEGALLAFPVIEFYYKNDVLDDPMMNEDHIKVLEIATERQILEIKQQALQVNTALLALFAKADIRLVDFKLEFGQRADGTILLADEISPDTCRLWDATTNEHLDKDIYRRDLGDLIPVYKEVLARLTK